MKSSNEILNDLKNKYREHITIDGKSTLEHFFSLPQKDKEYILSEIEKDRWYNIKPEIIFIIETRYHTMILRKQKDYCANWWKRNIDPYKEDGGYCVSLSAQPNECMYVSPKDKGGI